MPRPKKKQVTIVEPMKYDTVKMKLRGAERKSRARLREELEHDLAEVVSACVESQVDVGPTDLLKACEREARAVQCLYDLVSDACAKVETRLARVQRSLESMLAMCEKTPASSTRGMRMRMKSLNALHVKRAELVSERHGWALERQRAAGMLREVWNRVDVLLLECD